MEEIARIMASGFWPRLMGYISAARSPNPERVLQLIASGPTGIRTSYSTASQILKMGQMARKASRSWHASEPIWEALVPKVPGPSYPNIDGGDEGIYQFGLIVRGNRPGAPRIQTDTPLVFSSNQMTPYQETLEKLIAFTRNEMLIGTDIPWAKKLADEALNEWTHGNPNFILPMWVYERYIK